MDSSIKPSLSFGRASSLDVSQLDKINAIPNKTTDNILMDGLSQSDRHYISALMDNDSSDDEEDEPNNGSVWSPMVQSPLMMNTRIKKLRPSYAITLSLEDISYIRPSWGISKGIRTIEIDKKNKKKVADVEGKVKNESGKSKDPKDSTYSYFLISLSIVIILLTVPIYIYEQRVEYNRIQRNKIKIDFKTRTIEVYKPDAPNLNTVLRVQFGQGIPLNLKPIPCSCELFTEETRRHYRDHIDEDRTTCLSSLDWATRANLRVLLRKESDDVNCYDIKWQSYDSLNTPLVDCFVMEDEQWFGLGDVQAPMGPLNKLQFDWTPLVSNLSSELQINTTFPDNNKLPLGSYVKLSLFSTKSIHIGQLNTDFVISIKMEQDNTTGAKTMCIAASCTDKCTSLWHRADKLEKFRLRNNILEYSICSAIELKSLISQQFMIPRATNRANLTINSDQKVKTLSLSSPVTEGLSVSSHANVTTRDLPEGIGLIDRTIFATSLEFMPTLNGLTLRQHVDNIVKLGLKASSILLLDNRWEMYIGSFKLNSQNFPKAKLLFEILHNKGFKIVFNIKPLMDTGIGVGNINQLFQSGRLYSSGHGRDGEQFKSLDSLLVRRKSLFFFQNQSIQIESSGDLPYLCKCKESLQGYCAIIDLTQGSNRNWLINNLIRSSSLATEADGIQLGGAYTDSQLWDDHYRDGVSELVKQLMFREKQFTLPQYTGDFGYIQLAPRKCDWDSLKSVVNSVLNLGITGFSLVHPGSVWGDLVTTNSLLESEVKTTSNRMDSIYGDSRPNERSDEELVIRWLQVSVFLPILQFNNLAPIEKYGLQELVQNLTRIRRLYIVPELKKNLPYTPLISISRSNWNETRFPLIRPIWITNQDLSDTIVLEQFTIGEDILVAPILSDGLRQRDIFLPSGTWRDELRQSNLRGGKWLRNYPVELNEIAWFTRIKR